jgi:ElaB/YqjD/DUF883 family membrane-anchored ribosome-binding protein
VCAAARVMPVQVTLQWPVVEPQSPLAVEDLMNTTVNGLNRADASIQEFLSRLTALLDVLNDEGIEATTALRERIAATIDTIQPRLEQLRESIADTAGSVRGAIEENPWTALAAGAVLGVAVGCVAAAGAASLLSDSDLTSRAAGYRRQWARRYRPYARRAREIANSSRASRSRSSPAETSGEISHWAIAVSEALRFRSHPTSTATAVIAKLMSSKQLITCRNIGS